LGVVEQPVDGDAGQGLGHELVERRGAGCAARVLAAVTTRRMRVIVSRDPFAPLLVTDSSERVT
jgi:hypothetical protein